MRRTRHLLTLALLFTVACDDTKDDDHSDHEDHSDGQTTSLVLNLTPVNGDETLSFSWSDPEGDGDPVVDDILLPDGSDHSHHDTQRYTLDIELWNEQEDPVEDVALEIAELATEYQFFFTGSAVEGPATGNNDDAIIEHEYADSDDDGLPLGLSNNIKTLAWGAGELTVTLRHLPPEGDEPVKTDDLVDAVASDGFSAIGGDDDIQVTFNIEVE